MLVDISAAPAADAIPVLSGKDRLQQAVEDVLRAAARPNYVPERRRHPRTPYPYVFHIAPVAADGQTPVGEAFAVIGKHLSPHGVDFYHQSPVPYRRALAWFDGSGGATHVLLLELLWCRFNRAGWYENGGRVLRAATPSGELPPLFRPLG